MGIDESDIEDSIELITDAQDCLFDAISKLHEAAEILDDDFYSTYIIDKLEIFTASEHGFTTGDPNLDEWVESLNQKLSQLKSGNKTTKK